MFLQCQGLPSVNLLAPVFARSGTGCLLGSGPTPVLRLRRKDLPKDMRTVSNCAAKPRREGGRHGNPSLILTPSPTPA